MIGSQWWCSRTRVGWWHGGGATARCRGQQEGDTTVREPGGSTKTGLQHRGEVETRGKGDSTKAGRLRESVMESGGFEGSKRSTWRRKGVENSEEFSCKYIKLNSTIWQQLLYGYNPTRIWRVQRLRNIRTECRTLEIFYDEAFISSCMLIELLTRFFCIYERIQILCTVNSLLRLHRCRLGLKLSYLQPYKIR